MRTAANLHFRAAGGKRAAMLEKKHVRLLEAGTAAYGDMEHALFTSCAHGEVVESDSRFDPYVFMSLCAVGSRHHAASPACRLRLSVKAAMAGRACCAC